MERHELRLKHTQKDVEMTDAQAPHTLEPASSTAAAADAPDAPASGAQGPAAQERPHPDAINASDVYDEAGLLAYTHIGCADHSITIGQLPGTVTV